MVDLKALQKRVYENKVNHGFNTTDIYRELGYVQSELTEIFEAYDRKEGNIGEELADVTIYMLGLAEILGFDLEKEILQKLDINERRRYEIIDGKLTRFEVSE